MATITPTSMQGSGSRAVTETTMTSSDTFTYVPMTGQILIIRNTSGGSITPVIDGADGVSTPFAGVGSVALQSGYFFAAMGAGVVRAVNLDDIFEYLQGTIAVTGCSGATATLLNN
jgi:hypothetical protein